MSAFPIFTIMGVGFMGEDGKIYTEGIKREHGKAYAWFDNIWYHHRWKIIISLFFIIVLLVCMLQMCEREENDMTVVYAGPTLVIGNDREGVCNVLESVLPEDYSNDGIKTVNLISYQIYNKEEIQQIEAMTDAEGKHHVVDRQYISGNSEEFYDFVMTGEASVYMLAPDLYESLKEKGRLAELSAVLGYESSLSEDSYGIKLSELDIYEEYSALRLLPEDTMVCILRQNFVGRNSDDKSYEEDKQMFRALVEFKKEA